MIDNIAQAVPLALLILYILVPLVIIFWHIKQGVVRYFIKTILFSELSIVAMFSVGMWIIASAEADNYTFGVAMLFFGALTLEYMSVIILPAIIISKIVYHVVQKIRLKKKK